MAFPKKLPLWPEWATTRLKRPNDLHLIWYSSSASELTKNTDWLLHMYDVNFQNPVHCGRILINNCQVKKEGLAILSLAPSSHQTGKELNCLLGMNCHFPFPLNPLISINLKNICFLTTDMTRDMWIFLNNKNLCFCLHLNNLYPLYLLPMVKRHVVKSIIWGTLTVLYIWMLTS